MLLYLAATAWLVASPFHSPGLLLSGKIEGYICVGGRRGGTESHRSLKTSHNLTLSRSFRRANNHAQPLALPLSPFFSFLDSPSSQTAVGECPLGTGMATFQIREEGVRSFLVVQMGKSMFGSQIAKDLGFK